MLFSQEGPLIQNINPLEKEAKNDIKVEIKVGKCRNKLKSKLETRELSAKNLNEDILESKFDTRVHSLYGS